MLERNHLLFTVTPQVYHARSIFHLRPSAAQRQLMRCSEQMPERNRAGRENAGSGVWLWEARESTVQGWRTELSGTFWRFSVSLPSSSPPSLFLFLSLPLPPSLSLSFSPHLSEYLIHENSLTPLDGPGINLLPTLSDSFSEWQWGTCLWVVKSR